MLFKQLKTTQKTLRFTFFKLASKVGVLFVQAPSTQHGCPWLMTSQLASTTWSRQCQHPKEVSSIVFQVCQAVRNEHAVYYQSLAEQSAFTYSIEGLTSVWKHLRAILPKKRSKKNNIQHDLGDSLLTHFRALEAGITLDKHNLKKMCIQRNNREIARRPAVQQLALAELPTLAEIEDHCLRQRPQKPPGPDGIPSTLCRSGSVAAGPSLHALISLSSWASNPAS